MGSVELVRCAGSQSMLADSVSELTLAAVALLADWREALRRGASERAQSRIFWTAVENLTFVLHRETPQSSSIHQLTQIIPRLV